MKDQFPSRRGQQGVVLFIAIVLLLVMTLIGATAMKLTTSQERQAGILQDIGVAFQDTEASLRDAEAVVSAFPVAPIPSAAPAASLARGVYTEGPDLGTIANPLPYHRWSNANHATFEAAAQALPDETVFIVEEIAIISDVLNLGDPPTQIRHFYRITASETGQDAATHAVLQSTYANAY